MICTHVWTNEFTKEGIYLDCTCNTDFRYTMSITDHMATRNSPAATAKRKHKHALWGSPVSPRTKEFPLQNLCAWVCECVCVCVCVCVHRIFGLLKGNAFTAYADVIISLHFLSVNGIAESSIPQPAGLTQKNCTLTKVKFHTSGIVFYNSFARRCILYSHYEEKQLRIFNLGGSKNCHTRVKTDI